MAVIWRAPENVDVATKILTPDLGSISLHNYIIIHTIDFCFMCFLYFCYISKTNLKRGCAYVPSLLVKTVCS